MSQIEKKSICYLVYFNCRGTGNYYRYVIYQIGAPYQEIHIQPNGAIPECLKQFNISLSDIPCVIYKGKVIKDLYPTLRYLCKQFNRQDLLGSTIQQQTKISQLYCKNSKKKSQVVSMFLNYVPQIKKYPQQIKKIKQQMLKSLSDTPGCSQACMHLYAKTGNFLFDHLTIADFLFYQNCFYFVGFFGDISKRKAPILFAYKNFFQRTSFYKKYKQQIEKFKLVVPQFDESINQGFRLMWTEKLGLN